MAREYISPATVHTPRTYSHAVKVGNTIYISGQVGLDINGNIVPGGFEAQAERAFENLRLVLEAAGASFKDIVKVTTFLTSMSNRAGLGNVRERYFSAPFPASTLVEIPSLAQPEFLIEVEATAVID